MMREMLEDHDGVCRWWTGESGRPAFCDEVRDVEDGEEEEGDEEVGKAWVGLVEISERGEGAHRCERRGE